MKHTSIEWTDHTINFWWGCTEVSPACAHCYAKKFAAYAGKRLFGQPVLWGKGQPRQERLMKAREEALALNRQAMKKGVRYRVFANSMSDWLDDKVPLEWLGEMLRTIHDCPHLDWQLLTKRPENWKERVLGSRRALDVGSPASVMITKWAGFVFQCATPPQNIWIGTTVEDQERADQRIPLLLEIPAKVRFLSCEPLLGPVDVRKVPGVMKRFYSSPQGWHNWLKQHLHWIIAGGESGGQARPMHPHWLADLLAQSFGANVPFFFKQWGEWIPAGNATPEPLPDTAKFKGHRFPDGTLMLRAGTSKTGALLDGHEWRHSPQTNITADHV